MYKYPWPASALTSEDMARLHSVREKCSSRTPMTELVAQAVRRLCEEFHNPAAPAAQEGESP